MKILFVCTGNILRSPSALALARKKAHDLGLSHKFSFDAAGIKVFQTNASPDSRVINLQKAKHLNFNNIHARTIQLEDFDHSDLILVMTENHRKTLIEMSPQHHHKVKLLLKFCQIDNCWNDDVVDPFFKDSKDISATFNIIESAIESMLKILNSRMRESTLAGYVRKLKELF